MSRINIVFFLFGFLTTLLINNVIGALEGEGIVGGEHAKLGDYPYQISLEVNGWSICGGSIIGDRHVITAAHCVCDNYGRLLDRPKKVVAGIIELGTWSRTRVTVDVAKVYVPAEYGKGNTGDIAVLKLKKDLKLDSNPNLGKVELADPKKTYANERAVVSGFGWNRVDIGPDPWTGVITEINGYTSGKLRFAESAVLSQADCKRGYPSLPINERQICARVVQRNSTPEGVCSGDSGGPLVHGNNTLIGVVSTSPFGCKENVYAAVYTRVTAFLDFIEKATKDVSDPDIRTITL